MDMYNAMAPCLVCHRKNEPANELRRMEGLLGRLMAMGSGATDADVGRQDEMLRRNPYIMEMCAYTFHCQYGLPCEKARDDLHQLGMTGRKVMEQLALLAVMDRGKARSMAGCFGGSYPQVARWLMDL